MHSHLEALGLHLIALVLYQYQWGSTKSLHFEDAVYIIWECKILSEGTKILDG